MHLVDKHGFPYEKRKGRSIHNFIRACVLILRGKLWFKTGEFKPSNMTSEVSRLRKMNTEMLQDKDRMDWLDANSTHAIHSKIPQSDGDGIIRWRRGHTESINVRKVIDDAMNHHKTPLRADASGATGPCPGCEGRGWITYPDTETKYPCDVCVPPPQAASNNDPKLA